MPPRYKSSETVFSVGHTKNIQFSLTRGRNKFRLSWLLFDPWPLCNTEVHLKISEYEMLSFSVRKEVIENNNGLVFISLSKAGENEFLQTS